MRDENLPQLSGPIQCFTVIYDDVNYCTHLTAKIIVFLQNLTMFSSHFN